jgi:hypothetical protein
MSEIVLVVRPESLVCPLFDFLPGILFNFLFYHVFCFVLVFVPVKRTPRIRAESLVCALFVFLPGILLNFGFFTMYFISFWFLFR